ncbi:hypothetical protein Tco_0501875 [Tanacetum coccineum]
MFMTIQSSVKDKILATLSETSKVENAPAEMLCGLDQQMQKRANNSCTYGLNCIVSMSMKFATIQGMMRTVVMDEAHASRSPILWAKIGESSLIGPELVQETTDKVVLIKEKLKSARDRQKSYADNRRKPLEFEVGDLVMLKVSPCKGVVGFGKKGKLAPRYGNQSIERDRLIGIGFVLDFVEFILFTFGDKEMIL